MSEPSIKGSAFLGVVEDLRRLRDEGAVDAAELDARLAAEERAILDEEVTPGFWYPMATYDRMLQLLVEKEGDRNPAAYLHARGEKAMKRMMDMGLYAQFESLEKGWSRLVGRVMVTISSVVYNFMRWEIHHAEGEQSVTGEGGEQFTIVIHDDGLLSDNARQTIEGAVGMLSSRAAEGPTEVASARVAPDRVELSCRRIGAGRPD